MRRSAQWACALVLLAGLTACNSAPEGKPALLFDRDAMKPVGDGGRLLLLPADPAVAARYSAVLIETPLILADGLDEAEREEMTALLGQALQEQFRTTHRLALAPAPDVLRVRTAVTGISRSNVMLNVATTLFAAPLDNGGAAAEADLVDSMTGERVAALAYADKGGWRDFLGNFRQLGHARQHLREFARAVAELPAGGRVPDTL